MNYVEEYYDILNHQTFHQKLLKEWLSLNDPFLFYLDKKNDVIHYLIFGQKTKFIQIIFQKRNDNNKKNLKILEYGLQRKKIAKNYLTMIDQITQYNLILYPNPATFIEKEWTFKDKEEHFPIDLYKIYLFNLYYMQKKKNENHPLKNIFSPFL